MAQRAAAHCRGAPLGAPLHRTAPSRRSSTLRSPGHSFRCHAEASNTAERVREEGAATASGAPAAAGSLPPTACEGYEYHKVEERPEEAPLDGMLRVLDAVGRELSSADEASYSRLLEADAGAVDLSFGSRVLAVPPAGVLREAPPRLAPDVQQNIVPLPLPPHSPWSAEPKPEGSGEEIMLQGFNWDSWRQGWYEKLSAQADEMAAAGFSLVWLPPPTQSVSEQGYMPGDLYCLDSKYGSEAQLLACVKRLQAAGLRVLGDAVLNHRCAQRQDEQGVWNLYGGRMAWDQRAIVGDDPNFRGRGNRSSGDIFAAAPNIDHSQDFVKRDISEWLVWLRTHAGFDGWRLDFVKGFHGSHVKDYMEASQPYFAVGEYWDTMSYEWDGSPCHNQDGHRQRTVNWINAAGGLSTAFDITTKGIMHAVFERCEYWRLRDAAGKPPGLIGWWPSRACTFLENHDTGSSQGHWRFPHHALEQGYAYILTHPGTPCVFYDHFFQEAHLAHTIRRLMELRRRNRIHCRSTVKILAAERDVYAAEIDDRIIMKIGPGEFGPDLNLYSIADCGHAWAIWEKKQ